VTSEANPNPHARVETSQLTLTVDPLQDAIAWTRQNPEAYRALIQWSLDDMAAGIRPSMDAYGHVLRRPHMAARLGLRRSGPNLLFNDHLTSSLARLLKREHGIPFATRAARVDGWAEG